MGTIIYIDLLVIINLYITFFLLKASACFLHRKITNRSLLLTSLAGGVSSLVILLPPLPFLLNIGVKVIVGMVLVLIAFGFKSRYEYLKNSLVFIIINVVFAGLTLMLWLFAAPLGMEYNNGYTYFNISAPVLIVTTSLAYGLIRVLRYFLDVKGAGDREHTVTITVAGKSVTLDAIADSGNLLTDYFTGLPVIVCPVDSLKSIPQKSPRLLPYNTIDSNGLIPVFRVDSVVINTKPVNAMIGVAENNTIAIFNPRLLL